MTLWTVALQAPLSMGFSRQEYWSGLPCPPPGDLPGPGIEPTSLTSPALTGRFFTTSATWKVLNIYIKLNHFAVQQKLLQLCKQLYLKQNKTKQCSHSSNPDLSRRGWEDGVLGFGKSILSPHIPCTCSLSGPEGRRPQTNVSACLPAC